jgi:hypothetical protein
MDEDELLSAKFVLSPGDIIAEYQELSEEAARTHALSPSDLGEAAKDVCQIALIDISD